MAFLNPNQAIVAFKHLLGKSNTDVTKEAGNEAEGIFFNIPAETVWMEDISPTPAIAVTLGRAVAVTADMVVDVTSNGHALFATWPTIPPAGTDPITSAPFAYGAGVLSSILAGDRVRNAIPPAYGVGYEAKPYAGLNLISPGDQRDWIYQYNSGIFFQQDGSADIPAYGGSSYTNPTTIQLYVYIGDTLATFSGGGSSGPSEWYNSVFTISTTPPGSPSSGDRYLIASTGATGAWTGQEKKIAEWDGATWNFTTPTTGGSVLVDDEPGFIYIFAGTYPTGDWTQVPFGTTRAGVATGTDTYAVTVTPPILAYDPNLILLLTFVNANTGVSTLNVNAIGAVPLLKSDGLGGLTNLEANDIKPGLLYMIVYDGFNFQLFTGDNNFIPRTGTAVGQPVTGDIEVTPGTKIYTTGSPSNPAVKFEMGNLLVEGGVAKYDQDRTAEFDALTLITKQYADSIGGGTGDVSNISVVATYMGTGGSPAMDSYDGTSGSPGIVAYDPDVIYLVTFDADNTGPAQLSIDGLPYVEMLVGDETLGLVSLSAGDIVAAVIYYVVYDGSNFQVFTLNPTQLPGTYTNLNPSTVAVGGVPVGTTFNNTTYTQIFDMMFYPYVLPIFSAFSISGQPTTLEVGQNIAAGMKTFNWTTTVPANVATNSIKIRDLTTLAYLATGLANDGTENISFPSAITRTTPGSRTWRIYGTRTNSSTFTRDFTVTWYWRVFSGTSTNTSLTEAQIEALTNNGLQSAFASTITYAAGGYKYYCIPHTFGFPSLFRDFNTNLAVAMAGIAEGYTNTNGNGLYYQLVSVTNAYSQTVNYRVYRTRNILGGSIKIVIT